MIQENRPGMANHFPPGAANHPMQYGSAQQFLPQSAQMPPNYHKMNYAELVKFAEAQRQQIDQNNSMIQQREAKLKVLQHNQRTPQAHAAVQARLQAIRQEVGREEGELARLRIMQGEVQSQRTLTCEAKTELDKLQEMFTHKERELRQAVSKVESLKTQLETLRSQRRSAATAAQAMATRASLSRDQKLANQQSTLTSRQAELRLIDNRISELIGNLRPNPSQNSSAPVVAERPKATIEPFQVTPPTRAPPIGHKKLELTTSGPQGNVVLSSEGFKEAYSAVQDTLQQHEKKSGPPTAPQLVMAPQAPPTNGHLRPSKPDSLALINGYYSSDGSTVSSSEIPSMPRPQNQQPISAPGSSKMNQSGSSLASIKSSFDRYLSPFRSGNSPSTNSSGSTKESPPVRRTPQVPASPTLVSTTTENGNLSQSPSPSRQYANSNYIHSTYTKQGLTRTSPQGSDQGSISSSDSEHGSRSVPKVSLSISRRLKMQNLEGMLNDPPPPDLIPQSEKNILFTKGNNQEQHTASSAAEQHVDAFYQHVESDKLHIRSDNLRAAKRRSWAQDATSDEAEHIRRVLRREQMKGKFHINLSSIFGQAQAQTAHAEPAIVAREPFAPQTPTEDEEKRAETTTETIIDRRPEPSTERTESPPKEAARESPELEIRPPPPYEWHIQQNRQQQKQHLEQRKEEISSESSENDENERITVIDVDPEIQLPPPPAKGILRIGPRDKPKRSIIFDPLALLLDAALEGELDLVKKSAQRLSNVSTSNDEGITALHNAICAGHYEIVRFLVEANADVNSQDSDGWTPLHCAASCNNLPMVKFLVERGACVFATTVSDHETPADKCEEDEDGFDGCSQFLISIQEKIGHMNEGRVFAAFSYPETEREDELKFLEGEEMRVLKRGGESVEKGWWWARHHTSNTEGYVPRNYLGLYPRLAQQKAEQALKAQQQGDKEECADSDKRSSLTSNSSDKEKKESKEEMGQENKENNDNNNNTGDVAMETSEN